MAFGGSATGTTSVTLSGVTAGATICVFPTTVNGSATAFSASDSQGSYSARGSPVGVSGDTNTQLLILTNANSGTHTITPGCTGDTISGVLAFWYTGYGDVDNSHAAINQHAASVTSTANNGTSNSFTTTTANSIIIGVAIDLVATAACTVGTSPFTFTTRANGSIASINGYRLEDATWASTGSTNVAFQYASGSHQTAIIGFALAPASSNVTISVPAGSLTLSGQVPTVTASANQTVSVPAGSLSLTGQVPTVTASNNQTVAVPAGSLALTGQVPTIAVSANQQVAVPAGSLSLTAQVPTVATTANQSVSVPAGSLALSAFAPTVAISGNQSVAVPAGALSLTGFAPTVSTGSNTAIAVPAGALSLTGQVPSVQVSNNQLISVPLATLVLNGLAPTIGLTQNVLIDVPAGQLQLTGWAPDVLGASAPVLPTEVPAGRRRYRDIYRVTIDGQVFEFRSLQAARAFLAQAQISAQRLAERARDVAIAQAKPIELPPVRISASSRDLRPHITEAKREIAKTYRRATLDAEIGLLFELDRRKVEDEDILMLLL